LNTSKNDLALQSRIKQLAYPQGRVVRFYLYAGYLPNFLLFKPHSLPLSKREGRIFGKPLAFGEGFGVRLKKEPNSPARTGQARKYSD
jgi:hypothetical protein